jgi:hypothetical protein
MKKLFWITCDKYSKFYPPELPVVEGLVANGIKVVPLVWTKEVLPELGPSDYVIIRTPWDYLNEYERFREWVNQLSFQNVFNSEKYYLQALEKGGIKTVPTRWIKAKTDAEVHKAIDTAFPGSEIVIKPVIGAGALDTFRLKVGTYPSKGLFLNQPVMIQPFLSEVITDGECSMVYFSGKFSHAILKKPKSGDFRVQESYGGIMSPFVPSRGELKFGEDIFLQLQVNFPLEPLPLYARIDYVKVNGTPHLMELELLEPDLYFHHAPESIPKFVQALLSRMSVV